MVADFKNAVDTFLRTLAIYQEATKTVVISDPNFNPLQAYNQNNTNVTNTPNVTVVKGRILYDKNQEWSYVRPYVGRGPNEGQLKFKDQVTRSCRLKVDPAGYALLILAKQVEIDGLMFNVESEPRPHGLFGVDYYTFYFVRAL